MAFKIDMQVKGADVAMAKISARQKRLHPDLIAITEAYAQTLVLQIQNFAKGRPGPDEITGEYVNSWHVEQAPAGLLGRGISFRVTSDAPQAARLEYGFVGVDSLDRHYDQPPFPHVRPAVDQITPQYFAAVKEYISKGSL